MVEVEILEYVAAQPFSVAQLQRKRVQFFERFVGEVEVIVAVDVFACGGFGKRRGSCESGAKV